MDRSEHLAWCKGRALEYVKLGQLGDAITSMISDLNKHPDTHCDPFISMMGMLEVQRGAESVRHWIEGFN